MMQQPPNEGLSTLTRRTYDGRELTYRLRVVQQPQRARACGSGPRSSADRRPVDPPPVVELTILNKGEDITMQYDAGFMLYASLDVARPIAHGRMHPGPTTPVLTGVAVAGVAHLEKPVPAGYFIFPDLSVRHEGWYRLKFHLFEQIKHAEDADVDRPFPSEVAAPGQQPREPAQHEAMANRMFVNSTPFQVFSAKKFPGLNTSTELSKTVAEQGCRVRIRREIRQRRKIKSKADGDEEERGSIGTPESHSRPSLADHSRHVSYDGGRPTMHESQTMRTMVQPTSTVTNTPAGSNPGAFPASSPLPGVSPTMTGFPRPSLRMPEQTKSQPFPRPSMVGAEMASNVLPSISQLIGGLSSPRPRSYDLPDSTAQKRAPSPRSYGPEAALKDGARPSGALEAPVQPGLARQRSASTLNWVMNPSQPSADPGPQKATDVIEADDDPYADRSDSEETVLRGPFIYKRADGSRSGKLLTTRRKAH